eukprot:JZ549559.1.p1 GENE.JZ549559.1~~JZ549559.1.p1  ORF type:complete len:127 (+),score=19.84 JZ549559.1:39-419(+)
MAKGKQTVSPRKETKKDKIGKYSWGDPKDQSMDVTISEDKKDPNYDEYKEKVVLEVIRLRDEEDIKEEQEEIMEKVENARIKVYNGLAELKELLGDKAWEALGFKMALDGSIQVNEFMNVKRGGSL